MTGSGLKTWLLTISSSVLVIAYQAQRPAYAATVSVPFSSGFIGTEGQNPQKADNIKIFSTLDVDRADFFQNSSSNQFELQGNDISGSVRFLLQGGSEVVIDGAIVMPIKSWTIETPLGAIPMPLALAPSSQTREFADEDGVFNFDVEVNLPLFGLLAHYRGKLNPAD